MTLPFKVQPQAEAQLYHEASWYQDEEPGSTLWLELIDEFEAVLAFVCEHPEGTPIYEQDEQPVRRALLKRFPFAIYYVIEEGTVVVVRFLAMQLERGPKSER